MQTINLINLDKSDVKVNILSFPDGEPHVIISDLDRKDEVKVVTRIHNANDLLLLLEVGDILDRQEVMWDLYITYLMSMRMDRVMDFNRPFTLKIVASLINRMNFRFISIFEPHSNRTIEFFLNRYCHFQFLPEQERNDNYCVVFPDYGAAKRYFNRDVGILFKKTRDIKTGKLTGFEIVEENVNPDAETFILIDDLCDGGGTFLGELEILKKKYPDKKFYLSVSHCVNRDGIIKILDKFDKLITTNSYAVWDKIFPEAVESGKLKVIDIS